MGRLIPFSFLTLKTKPMRTSDLPSDFNFNAVRYDNCLAYKTIAYDSKYRYILYVFTGVSYKRYESVSIYDTFHQCHKASKDPRVKVIFITNKQLLDLTHPLANYHFIKDVKRLVFDGKKGTRYNGGSYYNGNYFDCLTIGKVPKSC